MSKNIISHKATKISLTVILLGIFVFVAAVTLQFNTVKEFLGIADHGTPMTILDTPDASTAFDNSKQTMVQIHVYTDLSGILDEPSNDLSNSDEKDISQIPDDQNNTNDVDISGNSDKQDYCTDTNIRYLSKDQELSGSAYSKGSDDISENQIVDPKITDPEIYGSFGSGSIWEYNEDRILVVTNYHVISPVVTKNALGYAVFYNGVISEFTVAAFDDDADCAFLLIDSSCMTSDQLKDLRCVVPYDYENATLTIEEPMFVVHSQEISREDMVSNNTLNMIADTSYVGYIMDPSVYVSALLQDMLYCKCSADAGMSGGPTFDAYGHYIGMLTGATDSGETVSVLLSDIETVYEKIK